MTPQPFFAPGTGADLRGADIPQTLYVVAYDDTTRWPDGVTLPKQPN